MITIAMMTNLISVSFPLPFLLGLEIGDQETMTQHKKQQLCLFYKSENAGLVNWVLMVKTGLLP